MAETKLIDVEVAYAQPDCQVIVALRVPDGTRVEEAVRRSGLLQRFSDDPICRFFAVCSFFVMSEKMSHGVLL